MAQSAEVLNERAERERLIAELADNMTWQELKINHPRIADAIIRRSDVVRILRHSSNWAYELRKSVRVDLDDGERAGEVAADLAAVLRDHPRLGEPKRGAIQDLIERLESGTAI